MSYILNKGYDKVYMECNGCDFSKNRTKEHLLIHAKKKIPTLIRYCDRELLPSRRDFLEQDEVKRSMTTLDSRLPFAFMPNDICEPRIWEYSKRVYRPYLFGIMTCGTKVCVSLKGILPYFGVKLPDAPDIMADTIKEMTPINASFMEKLKGGFLCEGIEVVKYKLIQMKPNDGFRLVTHPYMQIYFKNLDDYDLCYKHIHRTYPNCQTTNDDKLSFARPTYIAKVLREYKILSADWNLVSDYNIIKGKTTCIMIEVDVNNIKALPNVMKTKDLDFDKSIMAQWDIETNGELPDIRPPFGSRYKHFNTTKFQVFMINTSYYFHWNTESLMDICCTNVEIGILTAKEQKEKNTMISIICDSEEEIIFAHAYVLSLMKPEFLSAFNGAGFDWPIVREKLYNVGRLGELKELLSCLNDTNSSYNNETVYKYSFASGDKVKLSVEREHQMVCVAKFPGMIDTDVMLNFLRIYSKAETTKAGSLNFFLADNGLESKEDMAYKRMFKIHDRAVELLSIKKCHCLCNGRCAVCDKVVPMIDCVENVQYDEDDPRRYTQTMLPEIADKCCYCGKRQKNLRDMELVAIYCRIDCQRPQELNIKRTIINDKRELASLSFMPVYNTFTFADGEKVRNMMAYYAANNNVALSINTLEKGDHEKDWNVGGYVVPPKRGLYKIPVTGLDFESLYPSLIATYNLSPDMIVTDAAFAKFLIEKGYNLYPITDESNTHLTYNKGLKQDDPDNKVYKSIAWSVRHNNILSAKDEYITVGYDDNYKPLYGRKALPGECMGYMAYAVKDLKDLRRPVKEQLGKLSEEKEVIELKMVNDESLILAHRGILFSISKCNSKSTSIKILNNTFYGQVASFRNSFYNINIAGGITSSGRKNTKRVKAIVEELGFTIVYGDTDSLYIMCPDSVYDEARVRFANGTITKEEYYVELVHIAMKVMSKLQQTVFRMLVDDNGTLFLVMAYEEVGLPFGSFGKKKYVQIDHVKIVNFKPKKLFIRGLELKKQGQYDFSRELQEKYLWEIMNINNEESLFDLGIKYAKDFFAVQLNPAKFAKMSTYKPDKKNTSVLNFVKRMILEGKPIPDSGDKFRSVVVCKPQKYTTRGTMEPLTVGDKMEYLHSYDPQTMKLDIEYYLDAGVLGAFARFIAYHPRFQTKDKLDLSNDADYKIADKYSIKQAKAFLKELCQEFMTNDRGTARQHGSLLQKQFKACSKPLIDNIKFNYDNVVLSALNGKAPNKSDVEYPRLYLDKVKTNMKAEYNATLPTQFIHKNKIELPRLKICFNADYKQRVIQYNVLEREITDTLVKLLPETWKIRDNYKLEIETKVLNNDYSNIIISADNQKVIYDVRALLDKLRAIIFSKMNILTITRLIEEELILNENKI